MTKSAFDPELFSLDSDEVMRLDEALRSRWGVDLHETTLDLESVIESHPDPALRTMAAAALKEARSSLRAGGGEEAFYNVMCDLKLLGLATSVRRHILLDSIAFVASLIRTADIRGPVLDVGCHAGMAMDILYDAAPNKFHGIDPIERAIDIARKKTADRDDRLTFETGHLKDSSAEKYDLVYCIDSMPPGRQARGRFLKAVREHLTSEGLALIVSQHWVAESPRETRDQLKNIGLGFVFADVVGGWGGMPNAYSAEGCVVLSKASRRPYPSNIREHVETLWPAFARFANHRSTSDRRKTQAYFRTSNPDELKEA